jgi:hypothetical protein
MRGFVATSAPKVRDIRWPFINFVAVVFDPKAKTHRSSPGKHSREICYGFIFDLALMIVLVIVLLVFGRGKIPN